MPGTKRPTPDDAMTARRAAWQTDDFWQYAMYAAIAYIRAAASRAGVPVRQACQDLDESPGDQTP
jgi:hypothetical protein